MKQQHVRLLILLGVAAWLLAACGSLPSVHQDGAPDMVPVDLDAIPDATPKPETYSRYGNPQSYQVLGKTYYPLKSSKGYSARGIASWYGTKFHGQLTSSREVYDMYKMTAAHRTLPIPSYVEVTNLDNGRSIVVRVNDRGPFHDDRIIDLSYAAAHKLGILAHGTGRVEVQAIDVSKPAQDRFFLQVGAFSMKENAEQLQQQLQSVKIQSGIKIARLDNQGTVYRVQVGPFKNREQALQYNQQLQTAGIESAHIVTE